MTRRRSGIGEQGCPDPHVCVCDPKHRPSAAGRGEGEPPRPDGSGEQGREPRGRAPDGAVMRELLPQSPKRDLLFFLYSIIINFYFCKPLPASAARCPALGTRLRGLPVENASRRCVNEAKDPPAASPHGQVSSSFPNFWLPAGLWGRAGLHQRLCPEASLFPQPGSAGKKCVAELASSIPGHYNYGRGRRSTLFLSPVFTQGA